MDWKYLNFRETIFNLNLIEDFLIEHDLTEEEFCSRIGIDEQDFAFIVGEMPAYYEFIIYKICDELEITPQEFFDK